MSATTSGPSSQARQTTGNPGLDEILEDRFTANPGEPLHAFQEVLSGGPNFVGRKESLLKDAA